MRPKVKIMNEGTTAVITSTGNYYVRQMYKGKSYDIPRKWNEKYDRIEYYTLRGKYIPLATTECTQCGDIIQSQMCGHFVTCSCGNTCVDTDRWMPERHRILTK